MSVRDDLERPRRLARPDPRGGVRVRLSGPDLALHWGANRDVVGGDLKVGTLFGERFEILAAAGAGGMGTVYEVLDHRSGERAALKVLHRSGPLAVERFRREADVLRGLTHPAIVRYVDHGRATSGEPFLVTEWLTGPTLDQRLARGPLSIPECTRLVHRLADALATAHAAGVVHRDVKPSNVILCGGQVGRAKLIDFGVARTTAAGLDLTGPGMLVGTLAYMSPEQAIGDTVDAASDVYSLGALMFECVTGSRLVTASGAVQMLARILLEETPAPSSLIEGVPASLDALLGAMLRKSRVTRLASATEVLGHLCGDGQRDAPTIAATLGRSEQEVVSLVLASRVHHPASRGVDDIATVSVAIEEQRGDLQLLIDGSALIVVRHTNDPIVCAVRGARSALALARRFPAAPIALSTGAVVVRGQRVVGEVVDRASALLDGAGARDSGIRVDDATAGLLPGRFRFDDQGRLTGEQVDETRRTLLGRTTACVGRARELRMLREESALCFEEAVPRAVLLTGEPGIGKSRLFEEWSVRLPQAGMLIGRADPQQARSAYRVLASLLRPRLGATEGIAGEGLRARITEQLVGRVPIENRARVATFLGELLQLPFSDADRPDLRAARQDRVLMSDQIARAFLDFVRAEAESGPLVLVLEDAHWADDASLRVVNGVLARCSDRPLLVVALTRTDEETRLLKHLGKVSLVVRLRPLHRKAALALARSILGPEVDDGRVESIVRHAQGNAFMLEELVRAAAAGRTEIPGSVLAMVQARLSSLSGEARRVLRAGSIFGQSFWQAGVDALVGREETSDTTDEWLDLLVVREIVEPAPQSTVGGFREYRFRHALVQEAAYGLLTADDRVLGHRLAGQWLESVGFPDPAVLAEHYSRGQVVERARGFWMQAAEEALSAEDPTAALTHADRGVATGAEGETLGRLAAVQAEVQRWLGDFSAAVAPGRTAIELLPRGDPRWCRAAAQLGAGLARSGRLAELGALANELSDMVQAGLGEGPGLEALLTLASHVRRFGLKEAATELEAVIERLVAEGRYDREPRGPSALAAYRAALAVFEGDWGSHLDHQRTAARCAAELDDVRGIVMAAAGEGYALLELGDYAEAERALRRAMHLAEEARFMSRFGEAEHNLGLVLARLGRHEEALAVERSALDRFVAWGATRMQGACRDYLAVILLEMGRLGEARSEAEQAATLFEQSTPALKPHALATLAAIRLEAGDAEGALQVAEEALEAMQRGLEAGDSKLRLVHARALRAIGREDSARAAIATAKQGLEARAARIRDPRLRQGFLRNVPAHAATLELAAALGGEDGLGPFRELPTTSSDVDRTDG